MTEPFYALPLPGIHPPPTHFNSFCQCFNAVYACVFLCASFSPLRTTVRQRKKNIIFAYNVIKVCSILEIKHNATDIVVNLFIIIPHTYTYSQQHPFSSLSYIACYIAIPSTPTPLTPPLPGCNTLQKTQYLMTLNINQENYNHQHYVALYFRRLGSGGRGCIREERSKGYVHPLLFVHQWKWSRIKNSREEKATVNSEVQDNCILL